MFYTEQIFRYFFFGSGRGDSEKKMEIFKFPPIPPPLINNECSLSGTGIPNILLCLRRPFRILNSLCSVAIRRSFEEALTHSYWQNVCTFLIFLFLNRRASY